MSRKEVKFQKDDMSHLLSSFQLKDPVSVQVLTLFHQEVKSGFQTTDAKIDRFQTQANQRFEILDQRMDKLDQRMDKLEQRMDHLKVCKSEVKMLICKDILTEISKPYSAKGSDKTLLWLS
jgi:hypothetical protein